MCTIWMVSVQIYSKWIEILWVNTSWHKLILFIHFQMDYDHTLTFKKLWSIKTQPKWKYFHQNTSMVLELYSSRLNIETGYTVSVQCWLFCNTLNVIHSGWGKLWTHITPKQYNKPWLKLPFPIYMSYMYNVLWKINRACCKITIFHVFPSLICHYHSTIYF